MYYLTINLIFANSVYVGINHSSISGSDAEYIPVMIAKMLHPGRKVINIVTCGGEIGSFTLDCANGKHFSETLPVPSPDFEQPKIGQPLKGLGENVEAIAIKARLKTGNIANATREIEQILERSKKENAVSILHTVIGSKTGICESLRSKDNCIGVVDACQARVNFDEIKNVVQNGHFVLFTASKFFRAPPFCGAVLVPAHYVDQIVTIQSSLPKGLNHFLTSGNIPQKFHFWKTDLSTALNLGLILRWVAGIYAIEKSLSISFDERFQLESAWRKEICGEVEKSPYMEILDSTNIPSIVSIKVKIGLENLWLRKDELTKVCELMTEDLAHKIDNADQSFQYILKKECYMGQPVEIGSDFAVLRIALDYENIFQLKTNFEATLAEDKKLLSKLQSIIKNYQSLCL